MISFRKVVPTFRDHAVEKERHLISLARLLGSVRQL
jgi:hypothetical protein